jgi:hypothetical protein
VALLFISDIFSWRGDESFERRPSSLIHYIAIECFAITCTATLKSEFGVADHWTPQSWPSMTVPIVEAKSGISIIWKRSL